MLTLFEEPPELDPIKASLRDCARELTAHLTPTGSDLCIQAHKILFQAQSPELDKILLVRTGNVECWCRGKLLFYFEEGDLIGCEPENFELRTDYAVRVDTYERQAFFSALASKPELQAAWLRLLAQRQAFFGVVITNLAREEVKFNPEIRRFGPGDTIIEQGGAGNEVYTLIDGQAGVFVDSVNVGEVLPDEIFGAIAALTHSPRTATVIARSDCMVLCLPREKFLDLIKARPATVEKLVDDMARKLVAVNQKVVAFETGKL